VPEGKTHGALAAAQLQTIAEEILGDVERLAPQLINWIPAEGVWSIMDILCHIREFVPFWTGEALRVARGSGEQWGRDHTDDARSAAVENTAAYKLGDAAAGVQRAVQRSADALAKLSDAELAIMATSKNPRWGLKPASFIVDQLLVHHAQKHLSQIRRNVTQFADQPSS
jgi:hypothetical protein